MTDPVQDVTIGYSPLDLSEIVDKELKSPESITKSELSYLHSHTNLWRAELIRMKKRTEFQLTSSNTRRFSLYNEKINRKLTEQEYSTKLLTEKTWRCNATRFVQQLESRISDVKHINND